MILFLVLIAHSATQSTLIYDQLNIHNSSNEHQARGYCLECEEDYDVFECPECGDAYVRYIIAPLYKCNMTDVMAAIGLIQLKRYSEMMRRRRQIIERYNEGLEGLNVQVFNHYPSDDTQSSGHLYLVRLLDRTMEQRNEIITRMAERDIACNAHYKPLPMMTAYKSLGFDISDYPNAYRQFQNEVTLPLHTKLTDENVDYVIDNLIECVEQRL